MERFFKKAFLGLFFTIYFTSQGFSWGFFAHKQINRLAIFTLPPEMSVFYKKNIDYITESAVLPDKRRYAVKEEGPRHFIDLDKYEDSSGIHVPFFWKDALAKYSEDSLTKHGILPWHLALMKHKLTEAFKAKDSQRILKLSAEIGHYIGDGNVPLHTCSNYNGQFTNQHGIHGLWESRLPELYFSSYNFWVGPATYIANTSEAFWKMILNAHAALDTVLIFERRITEKFSPDKKYAFEERGATIVKVYSKEFCSAYHSMLSGQVERQMRSSVKMIGDIWYTCWADAGQPNLKDLGDYSLKEEEKQEIEKVKSEAHQDCNH